MKLSTNLSCSCLLLFTFIIGLAGCAANTDGLGLQPALSATDLEVSTRNHIEVERLLIERAGYSSPPPVGDVTWYPIVVAGYGYVDEKCNAFMDELFEADRRLRAGRNQLNDVSNAVTSILSYTAASRGDIGIVASAFGLASNTIDNYQIVRLVDLGPTKVQKLVTKAQKAYRAKTFTDRKVFGHRVFAMQAIAGYLDLCRIPTIVSHIDRAIESADFVADATARDLTSPKLLLVGGSEASAAALREEAGIDDLARSVPPGPTSPVVVQPKPIRKTVSADGQIQDVPLIKGAQGQFEAAITLNEGKKIQQALCIRESGNFEDGETRKAIKLYQTGSNQKNRSKKAVDGILGPSSAEGRTEFNELFKSGPCLENVPQKYRNAYERFRFPEAESIISLQRNLQAYIIKNAKEVQAKANSKIPDAVATTDPTTNILRSNEGFLSGTFDANTRQVIKLIQMNEGASTDEELTPELNKLIVEKS